MGYLLDNLTLYNWIGRLEDATWQVDYPGIFRNPEFGRAVWNTLRLTVVASIITAFCGQLLGYISSRGRGKWYGSLTEQLVFIPYLMPGVAFSAIYFAMFAKPSLFGLIPSLYGTFTLIVLVSVRQALPVCQSRGHREYAANRHGARGGAADIAGASFWRRMIRIVIPLAKQGFISGFMLIFISIAKRTGPDYHHDDTPNQNHVVFGIPVFT